MMERKSPVAHYYCVCKTDPQLKWNAPDSTIFHAGAVDSPTMLYLMQALCFDCRIQALPCKGQRVAIHGMIGKCIIIVAEPGDVIGNPDLHSFVQSAHHTTFSRHLAFLIEPGDALYLPFCSAPLIVGLPSGSDDKAMVVTSKKDQKADVEHVALAITNAYDINLDPEHSVEATQTALASHTS